MKFFTAFLTAAMLPFSLQAAVVHVTPDGNDANPGTEAAPVATLERSRDLLRQTPKGEAREILVGEGTFYLEQPLRLEAEDSGLTIRGKSTKNSATVLSGGRVVANWSRVEGDAHLWKAKLPPGTEAAQLMRAGTEAQVLARTPNYDPAEPHTGGWLFVDKPPRGIRADEGAFGQGIGGVHTVGDWVEWRVRVPTAGRYQLWMRYGGVNREYFQDDAAFRERMQIQVNGGPPVVLTDVPDTAAWDDLQWKRTGALDLPAGEITLRWTNIGGGGLNWDALVLAAPEVEAGWSPVGLEKEGATVPPGVILVQAEAFSSQQVKELSTPDRKFAAFTDRFTFRAGDLRDYPLSPEPRLHIFPAWGWVNAILALDRIDSATRTAWVKETRNASEELRPGNRYYVANIREGLDSPGEWWIDRRAGEILWWPRDEAALKQEVVLPALDRLIVIEGAENIRIQGLKFTDTSYTLDDVGVYAPEDAAIHFSNSRGCVVEMCQFTGVGGYALRLTEQAAGNQFLKNHVRNVGQGGVILVGWKTEGQPVDNVIEGNHFTDLGQVYKHVAAVYATTASGTRVAHNHIERVPRYGISFKSYWTDASSHRNIAEYNVIRTSNTETNDTGAIETLGRDKGESGNIIQYNLIEDVVGLKTTEEGEFLTPHMTWGIYLDDFSSGTIVRGNYVSGFDWGGVDIHGGRNNLIENNFFVGGQTQQFMYQPIPSDFGFSTGNRVVRNIFMWSAPEAHYVRQLDGDEATPRQVFSEFDHNLIWPADKLAADPGEIRTPAGDLEKWRALGFDKASRVANPGILPPYRSHSYLRDDSPAFELGYQELPWGKMGLVTEP